MTFPAVVNRVSTLSLSLFYLLYDFRASSLEAAKARGPGCLLNRLNPPFLYVTDDNEKIYHSVYLSVAFHRVIALALLNFTVLHFTLKTLKHFKPPPRYQSNFTPLRL